MWARTVCLFWITKVLDRFPLRSEAFVAAICCVLHEQSNFSAKTEKGTQPFAEQRGIRITFLGLAIRNPPDFSEGFCVLLQVEIIP